MGFGGGGGGVGCGFRAGLGVEGPTAETLQARPPLRVDSPKKKGLGVQGFGFRELHLDPRATWTNKHALWGFEGVCKAKNPNPLNAEP